VADDIFAPLDTTDFTTYMEQVLNSGAESYIVTWAGGGFVPLMQAATDLGVTEEMDLGATFIDNTLMPSGMATRSAARWYPVPPLGPG
jgi:branched-chain amino acid transport system substrate-binding protein